MTPVRSRATVEIAMNRVLLIMAAVGAGGGLSMLARCRSGVSYG
jgi:hypothetical protein